MRRLLSSSPASPSSALPPSRSAPPAGVREAHPLPAPLRGDRPRPCQELRPRPVVAGSGDLHGEPVQRASALAGRRDRPHAAAARHGAGDRNANGRKRVRRRRLYVPEIKSATAPGTSATCSTATATSAPPSRRTTQGRGTSTGGGRQGVGIQFPQTRSYVEKVERVKAIYAKAYATELGLR